MINTLTNSVHPLLMTQCGYLVICNFMKIHNTNRMSPYIYTLNFFLFQHARHYNTDYTSVILRIVFQRNIIYKAFPKNVSHIPIVFRSLCRIPCIRVKSQLQM